MKTQIRKQTINQSKKKQKLTQNQDPNPQVNTSTVCGWGLRRKKWLWLFFFFFLRKKAVEENSLSWVFNWVLGFGKKQLESDYWKVKNTGKKFGFPWAVSFSNFCPFFYPKLTVLYFCWEGKYPFSPLDEFDHFFFEKQTSLTFEDMWVPFGLFKAPFIDFEIHSVTHLTHTSRQD